MKRLNDLVYRFGGQYFYGEEVGVYLIDLEDKVILFDIPTYSEEIESYLKDFNKPLIAFLSHGSTGIEDGKIWQKKLGVNIYLHKDDKNQSWLQLEPNVLFNEPPSIAKNIQIIHTPGHSKGSICLLEKFTKTLFTGDTVAGNKKVEVNDFMEYLGGNTEAQQRLKSCKKLLQHDFESILPFHYEMILYDAKDKLQEYVQENL